jgi:hypothetical protein
MKSLEYKEYFTRLTWGNSVLRRYSEFKFKEYETCKTVKILFHYRHGLISTCRENNN